MGMSTHVVGFKAPDDKWRAMTAVWEACDAAQVPVPAEVESYFNGQDPDDHGVEVDLEKTGCCSERNDDYRSGFEIDLKALPADLTHLRFYNAW